MNKQGRQWFFRGLAGALVFYAILPGICLAETFTRICLPSGGALPLETAAAELAARTGATIVRTQGVCSPEPGQIILALGEMIRAYPEAAALLTEDAGNREWEMVKGTGKGLVIAGSSPRNVCRAALAWMENPGAETDRLSTYDFSERFTMWDNALNQFYRFSRKFDRRRHIREVARLGHTGIEVNRYADAGGYWVNHRKFPDDSYAWYMSYAPALDAFVQTSLTQGLYPAEELAANLADLRESVKLVREYGLEPGFVCYEPRAVPEVVFDRYPQLRGARVDHPGRSLEPRYSLDIASPRVLEHYAEALTRLMQEVPDLRYLVFWTEDSGSGIPFTRALYAGPNGSYRARASTVGAMVADFSRALLEAGRKVNPDFEVIMKIGWEYTDSERREITGSLPRGVTLSHDIGGRALTGGEAGSGETKIRESREMGVEPYASVAVSASWEPEPIIGIVRPSALLAKFTDLRRLKVRRIFTEGGIASAPQCPYQITQELYSELIRGEVLNPQEFFFETARRWCDGDERSANALVKAWRAGDDAIGNWPFLTWYDAGSGQTQGRWITRPLVPDISKLVPGEREAWERSLFTLPWDIGRVNIAFEGGIRMYENEQLERAVRGYDEQMIPGLIKTVALLDEALQGAGPRAVLADQRDRYLGLLLNVRTVRNLFEAQAAINNYLLKKGDPASERERLTAAIRSEISNTEAWLRFLAASKTEAFRVTEGRETPFLYKTPAEDLRLKLKVMQAHIDDPPGPFLKELTEPLSERRLLYSQDSP
jgi:hypothetical protein